MRIFNVFLTVDRIEGCEIYDFALTKWFKFFSMLLPPMDKVKKIKYVANYKEAIVMKCLKSYFGHHDFLGLAEGSNSDYLYGYCEDYYDWVRQTFTCSQVVSAYRAWIALNQRYVPLSENEYNDPLTFAVHFERQIAIYYDIISNLRDVRSLYIVGDGSGAASIACLMANRDYYSYEPNGIGSVAIRLGIVSSSLECESKMKKSVICLFNVLEYVEGSQFNDVPVIAFSSSSSFGTFRCSDKNKISSFRGKLFTNVDLYTCRGIPRDTTNFAIFKDKGIVVNPICSRSRAVCVAEGLKMSDGGVPVSFKPQSGVFSLKQRDNPSDARAKVGSIKYSEGKLFKYHQYGQFLYHGDKISKYCPKEYKSTRVVTDAVVKDGYVYAYSISPEQVMYRRMRDGTMMKLYFIKMMDRSDKGSKRRMKLGVYQYVNSSYYGKKSDMELEVQMNRMWDGDF